jgi:hypothetical protein
MKFINLEKLKITKAGLYKTKEVNIDLQESNTVFEIKQHIRDSFDYLFEETALETLFDITIEGGAHVNSIEDADAYFTTVVNILTAIFFDSICIPKGRPRERRLDVPENLKTVAASLSLLKKAINSQTYYNKFNLTVDWEAHIGEEVFDFHYDLIPDEEAQNDN